MMKLPSSLGLEGSPKPPYSAPETAAVIHF